MANVMKKLNGKRVLITAPSFDNALKRGLVNLGAVVIWAPAISIKEINFDFNENLRWDYLVFSSKNGVKIFMDRCKKEGVKINKWGARTCAIGKKTAEELKRYNIVPDLVPEEYSSKKLAASLYGILRKGTRILYPGGNIRNKNIRHIASKKGVYLKEINVYKVVPMSINRKFNDADIVIFTSAMQVKVANKYINLRDKILVSIGPETTNAITGFGLRPHIIAEEHTYEGVLRAVSAYFRSRRKVTINRQEG